MAELDFVKRLVTLESGLGILSGVLLLIIRRLWKAIQDRDEAIRAIQEARVADAKAAADAQIALAERLRATTEQIGRSMASLKDLMAAVFRKNAGE